MFFKKLFLVLFFAIFALYNTSAQAFDPPLRLEFDISQSNYPVNVELLSRNGLVLFYQKDFKEDFRWTISHYDTNFQLINTKSIPFETKVTVSATGSNNNFFYVALQSGASTRINTANTYILLYDIVKKKIDIFSFYQAEKDRIISISYLGNIFVYSTYNSKSEEHIRVFDKEKMNIKTFYEEISFPCELQDTYLDTVSHSLWVIAKFHNSKKQTTIHLTELDTNGVVLQEIPVRTSDKSTIYSCRIVSSDSGNLLLYGNYLQNEGSKFSTRNNNSGIFTGIVTNNQVEQLLFFEYSLFDSWYSTHKRNLSNSYNISYLLTQNDSSFIIANDFYAPQYQQQNYSTGIGFYPSTTSGMKLIGFKYQTACLLTFNKQGELVFYNSLNYSELLLKSVRPLLSGYIDSETNNALHLFEYGSKIFSIVYDKTEIVQPIKTIPLSASSHFENIDSSEKPHCQHWYGDNFICYSYQKVSKKYNSNLRKNSKQVFGINKLVYQ